MSSFGWPFGSRKRSRPPKFDISKSASSRQIDKGLRTRSNIPSLNFEPPAILENPPAAENPPGASLEDPQFMSSEYAPSRQSDNGPEISRSELPIERRLSELAPESRLSELALEPLSALDLRSPSITISEYESRRQNDTGHERRVSLPDYAQRRQGDTGPERRPSELALEPLCTLDLKDPSITLSESHITPPAPDKMALPIAPIHAPAQGATQLLARPRKQRSWHDLDQTEKVVLDPLAALEDKHGHQLSWPPSLAKTYVDDVLQRGHRESMWFPGYANERLTLKVLIKNLDGFPAIATEIPAFVNTKSKTNMIASFSLKCLGDNVDVDTRNLSDIIDIFRQGPIMYRDFKIRGSIRLRIRILEGSSTTSERYEYVDDFIVVDSSLPFACFVGASLVEQAGVCKQRFEVPAVVLSDLLSTRIEAIETLQQDYIDWLLDRPDHTLTVNQIHHVTARRGLRSPGCHVILPDQFAAFMEKEFAGFESVREIVTLTGNLPNVWAATCEEYVSWRWPWASECILLLIDTIVGFQCGNRDQNPMPQRYAITQKGGSGPELEELDSSTIEGNLLWDPGNSSGQLLVFSILERTRVLADGYFLLLLDVIESLAWFCTVLRVSDETKMLEHTVKFYTEGEGEELDAKAPLRAEGKFFVGPDPNDPRSLFPGCWFPFAPHNIVALGFPIPPRPAEMKGLELSFRLMSHICAIEYSAFHGENFALRGELTALYPVLAVGGGLQWHLRYRVKREDPFGELGGDQQDRLGSQQSYSICHPDVLLNESRHFLGLWPEAHITLGTNEHNYSAIRWTTADEKTEISRKDASGFSLSLGFKGFISATASRSYKIIRTRRNPAGVQGHVEISFEDRLTSAAESPVILYSRSEGRAWMVPLTSVLLHLAHARATYLTRKAERYGRHSKRNIPFGQLDINGGGAALNTILNNRNDIVLEGEKQTLEDYIKLLWQALNFDDGDRPRDSALLPLIYGHEFMSIAAQDEPFILKSHSLGLARQGWAHLLDGLIPIVLYEGFSKDVIIPTSELIARPQNNYWPVIPRGLNLMAATLPCLEHLSARWPSKSDKHVFINSNTYWRSVKPLFSPCDPGSDEYCNCVQILTRTPQPLSQAKRPNAELWRNHQQGVVVFQYQDRVPMKEVRRPATPPLTREPAGPAQVNEEGPPRRRAEPSGQEANQQAASDSLHGALRDRLLRGQALDSIHRIRPGSSGMAEASSA